MNSDVLIDNMMFLFLTDPDVAEMFQKAKTQAEKPRIFSPSKIPQSPNRRSENTPRLRMSTGQESSMLLSAASTSLRVPYLLAEKRQKMTASGRIWIFSRAPERVRQYEHLVIGIVEEALKKSAGLEEMVPYPRAAKDDVVRAEPEFYEFIECPEQKNALSAKQLFVQEVLGFPAILADELFPSDARALSHEAQYKEMLEFYERVQNMHPEQRLYALFDGATIKYDRIRSWCLTIVKTHPEFEFVSPEIYQIALSRVAAARLVLDVSSRGRWTLSYEQDYLKRGQSLLSTLFEIQNTTDISGLDSAFGYEQFYVIYCLYAKYAPGNDVTKPLSELQLRAYNDFQYSASYIRRAYQGYGFQTLSKEGLFQLEDFVPFFLADVAYDSRTSLDYQFGIGDTSGDGVLDYDEFMGFYVETERFMEQRGNAIPRTDVLTQMHDMVHFRQEEEFRFTKQELLRCRMHQNIFDAMFSPAKMAQFEQRDQYVANAALAQAYVPVHSFSGVWRAFWTQTYEAVTAQE